MYQHKSSHPIPHFITPPQTLHFPSQTQPQLQTLYWSLKHLTSHQTTSSPDPTSSTLHLPRPHLLTRPHPQQIPPPPQTPPTSLSSYCCCYRMPRCGSSGHAPSSPPPGRAPRCCWVWSCQQRMWVGAAAAVAGSGHQRRSVASCCPPHCPHQTRPPGVQGRRGGAGWGS